jgi:hypothetical protein
VENKRKQQDYSWNVGAGNKIALSSGVSFL